MVDNSSNNKRIAKNTLYLYARMLIVMAVSLFTVRVTLNALGAEDYGIQNVVGGVVTMFAFLTSTMVSASQRFFAFSLGKKDYKQLSNYFTMSLWCYLGLALIIIILAETIGLWFIRTHLTIPIARMDAAMWVYQFSIITFVFSILSIPYNSIIIAREKMNVYALFGLVEAFLKLAIAYLLMVSSVDKLILYSGLMCLMMSSIYSFYIIYGTTKFEECRIKRFWDRRIFREVMNYSGWSLFGAISGVFRSQGINILLNIFFGPVVNAARAIAYQVNNAINNFVLNFYKAVQPQIVKTYAAKEMEQFNTLVFRSSRFCFYLIIFLSLPVLLETPFILELWLKDVPENAVLFTRLVIITAIVDSTSYPLQTSISATGKIKYFQIVTGGLLILNLPVAYLFLNYGYPAETTMYIAICISLLAQITRIFFANHYAGMSVIGYVKSVLFRIVSVVFISCLLPLVIQSFNNEGLSRFILTSTVSLLWSGFIIWVIGITASERASLSNLIKEKINGFKNR